MKLSKNFVIVSVFSVLAILLIAFLLSGCGASGGTSKTYLKGILYVLYGSSGDNCVKIFDNTEITSNVVPDRIISGETTGILTPESGQIHIDTVNNELYVGSGSSVLVFANASTADGNIAPSRILAGGCTQITDPNGIFVDTKNDLLFVADMSDKIMVYSRTASGDAPALRTITGGNTTLDNPMGIFVDEEDDRLYVPNYSSTPRAILVFNNASSATGDIAPDRVITHETYVTNPRAVHVDLDNDLLYLVSRGDYIAVFENASTIDGRVTPSRVVSGSNTGFDAPMHFCVDPINDRLYQVNDVASSRPQRVNGFYGVNTSAFNGNIAPDVKIDGLAFHSTCESCGVAIDPTR